MSGSRRDSSAGRIEHLFHCLAEETQLSVAAGQNDRPVELRHEFRVGRVAGSWVLDAHLRFVPDDLCRNLSREPALLIEQAG